jgi:hypothetical protein
MCPLSLEYSRRDGLFANEVELAASEDRRPFLVGTSFEGDVSFDNRATQTPWGQWTLRHHVGDTRQAEWHDADDEFRPISYPADKLSGLSRGHR